MGGSDRELFLKQAGAFMEVARQAKPDSAEALNGLAIILMIENKHTEAFSMAEAAMRAGPQYPWAWFTYAAALDRIGRPVDAQKAVTTAGRLDNPILGGRGIPTPDEAWNYTIQHGRIPTVIPPR
jgi:predicted Zn-dependent protease